MANIEIHNLQPAGSELFNDSESFLNELNDQEMWGTQGGATLADILGPDTLASLISGNSGLNITGADSVGTLGETLATTLGGILGP